MKASVAIHSKDRIGESPAWDVARERLLWADHATGVVHAAKLNPAGNWVETQTWNLHRYLAAVIPRQRGGFVAVGATEVFLVDEHGASSPFAHLDIEDPNVKMNDAKCDSRGRIWTGTLTTDFRRGAAALYRIDPDGSFTRILSDLTLANGLAWSPDERTFYLIDSLTQSVDAFDFDVEHGHMTNRRTLITIEGGAPNGMTVDRGGDLWIAVTGGGEVRHYGPDGTLRGGIGISVPGATSCAFGGAEGKDLFITSRSGQMPDVARRIGLTTDMMNSNGPEAGALFVCAPGANGAPAHPYAG